MRTFCLIFILLTLSFCSKSEHVLPRLKVENHDSVRIIHSKIMLRSQLPLLAVNFINDTTTFSNLEDMRYYSDLKEDTISLSLKSNKNDIKVILDTSYSFSNRGFEYKYVEFLTEKEKQLPKPKIYNSMEIEKTIYRRYLKQTDSLKRQYLKSYPVLIYNNSKSDLNFGTEPIRIIQEALDVDKKWKPIEFSYQMPGCGVGSSIICFSIKPKHYLATAVIRYSGDFKTKIRLNYLRDDKVFYSNEITGFINRSQFNPKPAQDFLKKGEPTNEEWMKKDLSWMFHRPVKY